MNPQRAAQQVAVNQQDPSAEKEFFIDNLLVPNLLNHREDALRHGRLNSVFPQQDTLIT